MVSAPHARSWGEGVSPKSGLPMLAKGLFFGLLAPSRGTSPRRGCGGIWGHLAGAQAGRTPGTELSHGHPRLPPLWGGCKRWGGAAPALLLGPTKTKRGTPPLPSRWGGGGLCTGGGCSHTPPPRYCALPAPRPPPPTATPSPRSDGSGGGGRKKGVGARSRRGASPWAGACGSPPPGCQARLGSARLG